MAKKLTQEEKWQAESDAHTLRMAVEIGADKTRMDRAAKIMEEDLTNMQTALARVNKLKVPVRTKKGVS